MKKILAVLFCLSLTVLAGSLTACQQHEHSFAETLSYNETGHWYAATCEHTEEKSCLSFHTFGEWQTVIEPTYEAKGEEKRSCVCGYYQTREMDSIPGSVGLQYVENADGTYAVSGIGSCTDIDVIIPEIHNGKAVTGIEPDVFWKRASLRSVVIPDGVTSIGEWAFHDCTSLTSVVIPDNVTSIGVGAFHSCTSLTRVYYGGTESKWGNISFGSYNTTLTDATRYYYSETQPTEEGNYWHYDEEGNPVIWE